MVEHKLYSKRVFSYAEFSERSDVQDADWHTAFCQVFATHIYTTLATVYTTQHHKRCGIECSLISRMDISLLIGCYTTVNLDKQLSLGACYYTSPLTLSGAFVPMS